MDETIATFTGAQTGAFKTALADVAIEKLSPITQRMDELPQDKAEIDNILKDGTQIAAQKAQATVDEAKKIMGLWD